MVTQIDNNTLGLSRSVSRAQIAFNHGDYESFGESVSETLGGLSTLSYYIALIGQKYNYACAVLSNSFLNKIVSHELPAGVASVMTFVLAYTGIFTSSCFLVKEGISLKKQISFVSSCQDLTTLQAQSEEKPLLLESALPEWLYVELLKRATTDQPHIYYKVESSKDHVKDWARKEGAKLLTCVYLPDLIKRMGESDPKAMTEGAELISQMRSYATKKAIFHALAVAGLLIGIASCIGLFVSFPPLIGFILLGVLNSIAIAKYLLKNGMIENPDGGFSFFRLMPQFLQNLALRYQDYNVRKAARTALPLRLPDHLCTPLTHSQFNSYGLQGPSQDLAHREQEFLQGVVIIP